MTDRPIEHWVIKGPESVIYSQQDLEQIKNAVQAFRAALPGNQTSVVAHGIAVADKYRDRIWGWTEFQQTGKVEG